MSFQSAPEDVWLSAVLISMGSSFHHCGARIANLYHLVSDNNMVLDLLVNQHNAILNKASSN